MNTKATRLSAMAMPSIRTVMPSTRNKKGLSFNLYHFNLLTRAHHLMLPSSTIFCVPLLSEATLNFLGRSCPCMEAMSDECVVILPCRVPLPQSSLLVVLRLPCRCEEDNQKFRLLDSVVSPFKVRGILSVFRRILPLLWLELGQFFFFIW